MAHIRSDSLFASIRITFGIEAARVLVTPDSFFLYERVPKKLYFGPAESIGAVFPSPAPLDELFPCLTGTMVPAGLDGWQISHDSLYYELSTSDETSSYTVDPRIWRVVRYAHRSPSGELIEERNFSEFDIFGSALLPRRIEISRPVDHQIVSLYHRSVELNPEKLSLSFKTGSVSERILVGDRDRTGS